MKPTLLLFALSAIPACAAILLNDGFDDGNINTNPGLGFSSVGGGYEVAESGSAVNWTGAGGWGWGGIDLQSNNEYTVPVDGSYKVTWELAPTTLTVNGDQSWGDIRIQFALVSANHAQGSGSSEIWPSTVGVIAADIILKTGQPALAGFSTKDNSLPANDGGSGHTLANNALDLTVSNTISLELSPTDITMWINGLQATTLTLASINFGYGAGEEFENGFFPAIRASKISNGEGNTGVNSMVVEFNAVPEPSAAALGVIALGAALSRRRRN